MTTTVTLNNKKATWDELTGKQQAFLAGVLTVGLALGLTELAGMGVAIWGGISMIMGGGAATLLTGGGLVIGSKLVGAGLKTGIEYGARRIDFLKVMGEPEEPPSPVAAMTHIAPDFNLDAAVTLGKKIVVRPAIKLKSKADDFRQP